MGGHIHVGFGLPGQQELGSGCWVSSMPGPVGSILVVPEELDEDELGGPIIF